MDEPNLTKQEFELFRTLIHKLTGISLSDAKQQLVKSRLQKRLRALNLSSYKAYYDLVIAQGTDSEEVTELVNAVTTNKTDFFREPHHFEFVSQHILPEMKRKAEMTGSTRKLRIWHAGCSTGEEPYTLAITLAETLGIANNWDIRQLASDIDTKVLAHAEQGIYERVDTLPLPILKKYFLKGKDVNSDHIRVRPELQQYLTFKRINLLEETWPISRGVKFDIIFCRNVVIYFDKPTRQKLFARYKEILQPGGYLFIGHSESLLGISDAFESLGKTIYRLPEKMRATAASGGASAAAARMMISRGLEAV